MEHTRRERRWYLDGHASAVEAKREENLLSLGALKSSSKFSLREGEGMPKMQTTVHVRVGKGHHELVLAFLSSISLKNSGFLPLCLHCLFNLTESILLISLQRKIRYI